MELELTETSQELPYTNCVWLAVLRRFLSTRFFCSSAKASRVTRPANKDTHFQLTI